MISFLDPFFLVVINHRKNEYSRLHIRSKCSNALKTRPGSLRLVSRLQETARASESACEHEGGGAWEAAGWGRMLDAPRIASPATLCTHTLCHIIYTMCTYSVFAVCCMYEKKEEEEEVIYARTRRIAGPAIALTSKERQNTTQKHHIS